MRRWPVALVTAAALLPLAMALLAAVRAPRAHVLLDFWHVLAKVTTDDGSLQVAQLASYHLEQPFVVPSLLFWADAAWFGGDNRVLTVLSVALAAATALALRTMLPRSFSPLLRAGLTAAFAFALLSTHGTELWVQGTNGISWLPALFAAVAAIALSHRDRVWGACAAAAFGCLCFGAAFPAWFAIALVAWLRGRARRFVVVPLAGGVLVLGFWLLTRPAGPQSLASTALDLDQRLAVFFAALGGLFTTGTEGLAVLAGSAVVAVLAIAALPALRSRTGEGAGWVGIAAYAVALAAMLAIGRTTPAAPEGNAGLISRYVLVSALAVSAALVLCCLRRPALPVRHAVLAMISVGLASQALGAGRADAVDAAYAPLNLVPPAMRAEATSVLNQLHIEPGVIPAARALGAYPFTTDYAPGCDRRLGDTLDLASLPALGATGGAVDTADPRGDTLLSGWAAIDAAPAACVLVADPRGTVVGSGITGLPHPGAGVPGAGWNAVAPPGTADLVVLVGDGATLYRITG